MSDYYLVVKRLTTFDNYKDILKAYNHYVDCEHAIQSDSNYIDSLFLLDSSGQILHEYHYGG